MAAFFLVMFSAVLECAPLSMFLVQCGAPPLYEGCPANLVDP